MRAPLSGFRIARIVVLVKALVVEARLEKSERQRRAALESFLDEYFGPADQLGRA